jgi:hypothetical protein
VEFLLDAGGHRKKLLNKEDASESMVHNYMHIYVYVYIIQLAKDRCIYVLILFVLVWDGFLEEFFKVFRVWDELLVFFSLYLPPAWPSKLQPSVIAPEAGTCSGGRYVL